MSVLCNFVTHVYSTVPEQPKVPTTPTYTDKTLPQTGDEAPASLLALGTLILGGLGLASTKRRKED